MTTTAPTLIRTAAFLKRWAPGLRHWKRAALLNFVGWYWTDARAGIVHDHGRIVAVALARCVSHLEQADAPYYHDETAPIVWVDDIVSRHPLGITLLLGQVRQRFGTREAFAGRVFNRDGELRMLPFRVLERFSQPPGDSHHGFTLYSSATRAA